MPRGKKAQAAPPSDDMPRPKAEGTNGLSAEDFMDFLGDWQNLETEGQRINAKKSQLIQRLEAKGGDGKDFKRTHGLVKLDRREAIVRIERQNRYAGYAGLIEIESDGQASMVKMLDATKLSPVMNSTAALKMTLAHAYNDGWNSGRHNASIDSNPFSSEPGSEKFAKWRQGHVDGVADRGEQPSAPKAASTAREKPASTGRKEKAQTALAAGAKPEAAPSPEPATSRSNGQHEPEVEKALNDRPGWRADRDFTDESEQPSA